MCGIFGCIKNFKNNYSSLNISKITLSALNLLKNRGYDSCGIYLNNDKLEKYIIKFGIDGEIIKDSNLKDIFLMLDEKINNLENPLKYNVAIGHTRWATHGGKTDYNSHPHSSNDLTISLVHNGIISNYSDLREKYLSDYTFYSNTDTEVIVNMIQYLKSQNMDMMSVLQKLTELMEGTWACIIHDVSEPSKLYFMKNENPLLIATSKNSSDIYTMFTSEPSGFLNLVSNYILLRDKTFGYVNSDGEKKIVGEYKELELLKFNENDIILDNKYKYWMYKEILEQSKLNVLIDPITTNLRYDQNNILFNLDFIKPCKYLYIIACGSSYYAGLLASHYFRYTKAFEFVNVFDGGEFTKSHLEAILNPEEDLLVLLITQSGETRDLNIATTICREFSSNRKNKLIPNSLIKNEDENIIISKEILGEIKIIGIINVIGSLISRRTIENIYTNCGRENAVASTKSCTSQILACLFLAIYKSQLNNNLNQTLKKKFFSDLNRLEIDINEIFKNEDKIVDIAKKILEKNKLNMFLLGKDELHASALEGALKIKEIAYLHAEAFNITALKHGPYALIEKDLPIIILYKERDHFVKSIIEEIKTRGAYIIEISSNCLDNNDSIKLPCNKTFTGLIGVIVLQLLSYHLSILKGINPDRPRNLAKVVTVD